MITNKLPSYKDGEIFSHPSPRWCGVETRDAWFQNYVSLVTDYTGSYT